MPDLYLDVLCPDCHRDHDLYNTDPATHAGGSAYRYTCPVSRRSVVVRLSFPEALATPVPAEALALVWTAD